ncbi:hypothetical protein BH09ACT6_BH09ACT6_15920 [soil metagenome]
MTDLLNDALQGATVAAFVWLAVSVPLGLLIGRMVRLREVNETP